MTPCPVLLSHSIPFSISLALSPLFLLLLEPALFSSRSHHPIWVYSDGVVSIAVVPSVPEDGSSIQAVQLCARSKLYTKHGKVSAMLCTHLKCKNLAG